MKKILLCLMVIAIDLSCALSTQNHPYAIVLGVKIKDTDQALDYIDRVFDAVKLKPGTNIFTNRFGENEKPDYWYIWEIMVKQISDYIKNNTKNENLLKVAEDIRLANYDFIRGLEQITSELLSNKTKIANEMNIDILIIVKIKNLANLIHEKLSDARLQLNKEKYNAFCGNKIRNLIIILSRLISKSWSLVDDYAQVEYVPGFFE